MKLKLNDEPLLDQLTETIIFLKSQWHKRPVSRLLFLTLCLNLLLAPAVYAATGGKGISPLNAYAIGLLGLVTVGLGVYLLVVMLQPQRF